jgi:hypothetical protein
MDGTGSGVMAASAVSEPVTSASLFEREIWRFPVRTQVRDFKHKSPLSCMPNGARSKGFLKTDTRTGLQSMRYSICLADRGHRCSGRFLF